MTGTEKLRKEFEYQVMFQAIEVLEAASEESAENGNGFLLDNNFIDYKYFQGLLTEDQYEKKLENISIKDSDSGWDVVIDYLKKRMEKLAKQIEVEY